MPDREGTQPETGIGESPFTWDDWQQLVALLERFYRLPWLDDLDRDAVERISRTCNRRLFSLAQHGDAPADVLDLDLSPEVGL